MLEATVSELESSLSCSRCSAKKKNETALLSPVWLVTPLSVYSFLWVSFLVRVVFSLQHRVSFFSKTPAGDKKSHCSEIKIKKSVVNCGC